MRSPCVLQSSVVFHLGGVWCDKLLSLENKNKKRHKQKKQKREKAIWEWSFQPGPKVHALVQTIKEENHYVDIFLCNSRVQYLTYCIEKKTSHVVLSRTKHPWRILLAILDTFSRLRTLWFLDLSGLFSPEERRPSVQWSLLMSEERKMRTDSLVLSMLRNLEMCPSSSCFLSRLSWCSSVSTFYFLPIILLCHLCDTTYTYNYQENSLLMPSF